MLRLAVTRPSQQLTDLTQRASARGIEIVALPVITICDVPFEWPVSLDASDVDWVFFTSANGVQSFFNRLRAVGLQLTEHTQFASVGKKTSLSLEEHGFSADFEPSDAYGQLLFEEAVDSLLEHGDTVIYARGADVNYDPTELFEKRGIHYIPLVCYETASQTVHPETVARLTSSDYILFTAPSAVTAYHEQFGKPLARPIAIGRSTAATMNRYGWFGFITMRSADIDNILEYV